AATLVNGEPGGTDEVDFAAADYVAAHDQTSRLVLEAFGAPGSLERTVKLPFGERQAGFLMLFVAGDQLAHAWDLARALGKSTDIAPEVSAELLVEARTVVSDDMRGADGELAFGPEQKAPPRASAADRLQRSSGDPSKGLWATSSPPTEPPALRKSATRSSDGSWRALV
ncbi:MAG: hypothetical protein ACRD6W_10350, partial [Nitrososphaerales archaeon]